MGHHETRASGQPQRNADMLEELGLRDYLADRFGILGTPDDFVARITELETIGVRNIAFTALMPDKLEFLQSMRTDVIPRFSRV